MGRESRLIKSRCVAKWSDQRPMSECTASEAQKIGQKVLTDYLKGWWDARSQAEADAGGIRSEAVAEIPMEE